MRWKYFNMWKYQARKQKLATVKTALADRLLISNQPLYNAMLQIWKAVEELSHLDLLKLDHQTITSNNKDFKQVQMEHIQQMESTLNKFETLVVQIVGEACEQMFLQNGFTSETYTQELEFSTKVMEKAIEDVFTWDFVDLPSLDKGNYPAKWLSYSEQRDKAKICSLISKFIRLIDFLVQNCYHNLVKISMISLLLKVHERVDYFHKEHPLQLSPDKLTLIDKLLGRNEVCFYTI